MGNLEKFKFTPVNNPVFDLFINYNCFKLLIRMIYFYDLLCLGLASNCDNNLTMII